MKPTHAESVFPVLDENVPDPPESVKEPLDVSLADVVREVAKEHAAGVAVTHRGQCCKESIFESGHALWNEV